jgi:hypothetical protein
MSDASLKTNGLLTLLRERDRAEQAGRRHLVFPSASLLVQMQLGGWRLRRGVLRGRHYHGGSSIQQEEEGASAAVRWIQFVIPRPGEAVSLCLLSFVPRPGVAVHMLF